MIDIQFHVELADPSVGIMTEGFYAWNFDGNSWCDLVRLEKKFEDCEFSWESNDGAGKVKPPPNHIFVEKCLHAFAEMYYMCKGNDV